MGMSLRITPSRVSFELLKRGEQLGVDEIALKSILVGYPDRGLVEYLHWKEHGLEWVIKVTISCKR